MANYNYNNLVNTTNYGMGLGEVAYLAPKSWLDTISVPTAPFNKPGDSITIKTPHTFKAPRTGFVVVQLAPQKNKLGATIVGDLGTQKYNQKAEVFFPGNTPADHEAMQNLLNTPLIVLLPDANCPSDVWYQLGCDCQSAWLSAPFDTGTTKDGTKGFACEIMYDGSVSFYSPGTDPVTQADNSAQLGPVIITPAAIAATTASVNWAAVTGANGYSFDISTSPTFATLVAGQSGTTALLTKNFTGLTTATNYYVRVKATDSVNGLYPSDYTILAIVTA